LTVLSLMHVVDLGGEEMLDDRISSLRVDDRTIWVSFFDRKASPFESSYHALLLRRGRRVTVIELLWRKKTAGQALARIAHACNETIELGLVIVTQRQ